MSAWTCASCGGANPDGTKFCGHCGSPADVGEALKSFVAGPVAERLVEAGGHIPEERRLVTALFADVSGFTALADRLDPEQLLEVIDPVISALSSVVDRHGGYVEKFAGDALLALFGAPVTHEDDAARAVRVALDMHDELARVVTGLPHEAELTLHVGINSGHGIARILGSEARMDYAVLGDSVILAQRLESAAPPGETYVSETTVQLTADEFEFAPVGELTLKGKAEPVPAWRLLGVRAAREGAGESQLIGRESELGIVADVLAELREARGGVLLVTGEAGIGKSRLLGATRERAAATGAHVFHARCIAYGAGVPYWPYLDLVRRATGLREDEALHETRARLESALAAAGAAETAPFFARLLGLPPGDADVAALEPEAFRRRLHESFAAWLRAASASAPAVVALEDVHWADASSLALTGELSPLAAEAPILFVLVGRPESRTQLDELVGWRPHRAVELEPLNNEQVRELATQILGGIPPEELVAFVSERTNGNPFFVQELLRTLRDNEAVVLQADGQLEIGPDWNERQLPPTIEGVLAARIDRLPRDAAALLQTASVIGRRMRVSLLQAVAGPTELETSLVQLVGGGFLDRGLEDGEPLVAFHHALVQDAAYSRLLRRRRRELHLRVAETAETLYGAGEHVIDLLARHLYLAESPKAREYLARAGDRAKRLFANEEAMLHFGRALELAPEDDETRLKLADLNELVGKYDEALRLYESSRTETSDVRAWRGLAATHRKRGEYKAALSVVDQAFASDELKGADLSTLWLESGWTLYLTSRIDEAIDVFQAGIEAADGKESSTLGHLFLHLARAEVLDDRAADALAHATVAERLLDEYDDARGLSSALRVAGGAQEALGNLDEAVACLRRGLALAERVGNVEEIGGCLINLGLAEQKRGLYAEAIACNRRAIQEFERVGHGSGRTIAYANLGWALVEAGEYAAALEACERAIDLAHEIGHPLTVAETTDTMATADFRTGDYASAAERSEQAAALFEELGAYRRAAESLELAAEAWGKARNEQRARAVLGRARMLAAQPPS